MPSTSEETNTGIATITLSSPQVREALWAARTPSLSYDASSQAVVEFTVTADSAEHSAPQEQSCSVVAGVAKRPVALAEAKAAKAAARIVAKAGAKAAALLAEEATRFARRRAASFIPDHLLRVPMVPGGLTIQGRLLEQMSPFEGPNVGAEYGQAISSGKLSLALDKHRKSLPPERSMKRVWRDSLLVKRTSDVGLRSAVAYHLGISDINAPRVTDAIVRLWFRYRCHLNEETRRESDKTRIAKGKAAAKRRMRGDFLVKRGDQYLPAQVPGDRSAPTWTGQGLTQTLTIRYRSGDGKRTIDNINASHEHTAINREVRSTVEALAIRPELDNGKLKKGDVAWLLHRSPLSLQDSLMSGFEEAYMDLTTGKPRTLHGTVLTPLWTMVKRVELAPVLMPQVWLMLQTLAEIVPARGMGMLVQVLRKAALKSVPKSHNRLVSDGPTFQPRRMSSIEKGMAYPQGVVSVSNPETDLTALKNDIEAYSGPTDGAQGWDVVATINKTADSPGQAVRWVEAKMSFKKYAEVFGTGSSEDVVAFHNRLILGFREAAGLEVVEYDPSKQIGLTFHIFNIDKSQEQGVWAVQSGSVGLDNAVGEHFSQQWAAQSCMRTTDYARYSEAFYAQHTDTRIALVVDRLGKVYGRAILWPSVMVLATGKAVEEPLSAPFMDRLYTTTPRAARAFAAHAKANGYFHRFADKAGQGALEKDGEFPFGNSPRLRVPFMGMGAFGPSETVQIPYPDTFQRAVSSNQPTAQHKFRGLNTRSQTFTGSVAHNPGNLPQQDNIASPHTLRFGDRHNSFLPKSLSFNPRDEEVLDELFEALPSACSAPSKGSRPSDFFNGVSAEDATARRLVNLWGNGRWSVNDVASAEELGELLTENYVEPAEDGDEEREPVRLHASFVPFASSCYIGPAEAFVGPVFAHEGQGTAAQRTPRGIYGAFYRDPWNLLATRINGDIAVRKLYTDGGATTRCVGGLYASSNLTPNAYDSRLADYATTATTLKEMAQAVFKSKEA